MMNSKEFVDSLIGSGITYGCGMRDEFLLPIIEEVEKNKSFKYVPVFSGKAAIAAASGLKIAGKGSCILLPNYNLWSVGGIISTFNLIYCIPVLLIISWRGEPRINDGIENSINGQLTTDILDSLGIYYTFPTTTKRIKFAIDLMEEDNRCSAILVRRGEFS